MILTQYTLLQNHLHDSFFPYLRKLSNSLENLFAISYIDTFWQSGVERFVFGHFSALQVVDACGGLNLFFCDGLHRCIVG